MSTHTHLPKEIFVGTNSNTGWAIPVERKAKDNSFTAAFEKRMERVKAWAGKTATYTFYDNKLLSGFKIVGFNTRYSNANKLMLLKDPRGFTTEMAISDFGQLIKEITIENGIIKDPLMYQADKLLITAKRRDQIEAQNKKFAEKVSVKGIVKPSQLKLGTKVRAQLEPNNVVVATFFGRHYVTKISSSYGGKIKLKALKSKSYLIHIAGNSYQSGFVTPSSFKVLEVLEEPTQEYTEDTITKKLQKTIMNNYSTFYDEVFAISKTRPTPIYGFEFSKSTKVSKYYICKLDGSLIGPKYNDNKTPSEYLKYVSTTTLDEKKNEITLFRASCGTNQYGYNNHASSAEINDFPPEHKEKYFPIKFYAQLGDNKYEV